MVQSVDAIQKTPPPTDWQSPKLPSSSRLSRLSTLFRMFLSRRDLNHSMKGCLPFRER